MHNFIFTRVFAHAMLLLFISSLAATAAAESNSPVTAKRPVTDTYTGASGTRQVVDDYRWLETLDDPAVKQWVAQQNSATRLYLDALPSRVAIRDELKQLIGNAPIRRNDFAWVGGGVGKNTGGKLFALKTQPPKNQPMLVVLDGPEALESERIVLDPNQRNDKGTTAIDWYVPSRDGRMVAVSLSDNGSEQGTLHIFETATGKEMSDTVPRVQNPTGGGSVAWTADGSGLWYTRYPAPTERPKEDAGFYQQVYFHKLGTKASADRYAFGRDLPRIAEIHLEASEDGKVVIADVSNGDGGEHGFWMRGPSGQWKKLAGFAEGYRQAVFGRDGKLYALALKGSPRGRVVAMPLDDRDGSALAKAKTIIAQSDAVIETIVPTATRLYVEVLVGGPSEMRVYTLAGEPLPAPASEPVSSATVGARLAGDAILFGIQSFVTPFAWYSVDPARDGGQPVKTMLSPPQDNIAMDDVAVTRLMAKSKDGTDVPVNIVAPKNIKLDGSNPTLLTSYGSYGVSVRPRFSRLNVFWLRHGGVYAQANIRGGGEFGEDWHLAGNLTNRQNVFDDFAAAARLLIDRGDESEETRDRRR